MEIVIGSFSELRSPGSDVQRSSLTRTASAAFFQRARRLRWRRLALSAFGVGDSPDRTIFHSELSPPLFGIWLQFSGCS